LTNIEIALASLKSFHELLGNQVFYSSSASNNNNNNNSNSSSTSNGTNSQQTMANQGADPQPMSFNSTKHLDTQHWLVAWKLWTNIGLNLKEMTQVDTKPVNGGTNKAPYRSLIQGHTQIPINQTYLTCYMDILPVILNRIYLKFTDKDFDNYSTIVDKILMIPVMNGDFAASFIFQHEPSSPSSPASSSQLTPLQNSTLQSIKTFIQVK
jgi:hypothetical protein